MGPVFNQADMNKSNKIVKAVIEVIENSQDLTKLTLWLYIYHVKDISLYQKLFDTWKLWYSLQEIHLNLYIQEENQDEIYFEIKNYINKFRYSKPFYVVKVKNVILM